MTKKNKVEAFIYHAELERVVDGDTIDVTLDLGFNVKLHKQRCRLAGIDTPESRTRDLAEKALGKKASARLKELCTQHKGNLILRTSKEGKGKFGRILGSLYPSGSDVSLNDMLVSEGHARPYYGGSKDELEAKHMKNKEILIAKGLL